MADNTAGQTLAQSADQGAPSRAFGKDTFDATAIVAADAAVLASKVCYWKAEG